MVAKKVINTNLLDLSVKKNFESVKDGTGKPLKASDGKSLIGGFLNLGDSVSSVVDNALQEAISSLKNITPTSKGIQDSLNIDNLTSSLQCNVGDLSLMSKLSSLNDSVNGNPVLNTLTETEAMIDHILPKVRTDVMDVVKDICRVIKIPSYDITSITDNAMRYARKNINPLGSSIGLKTDTINLASSVFKTKLKNRVNDTLKASIVGSVLKGSTLSGNEVYDVVDTLVNTLGKDVVSNGLKTAIRDNTNYNSAHYEAYLRLYDINYYDTEDYTDEKKNELKQNLKIDSMLESDAVINKRYIEEYDLKSKNIIDTSDTFKYFKEIGCDSNNIEDLIYAGHNKDLEDVIPKSYQGVIGNTEYKDLKYKIRSEFTPTEKMYSIHDGTTLIEKQVLDKKEECCKKSKILKKNEIKQTVLDGITYGLKKNKVEESNKDFKKELDRYNSVKENLNTESDVINSYVVKKNISKVYRKRFNRCIPITEVINNLPVDYLPKAEEIVTLESNSKNSTINPNWTEKNFIDVVKSTTGVKYVSFRDNVNYNKFLGISHTKEVIGVETDKLIKKNIPYISPFQIHLDYDRCLFIPDEFKTLVETRYINKFKKDTSDNDVVLKNY